MYRVIIKRGAKKEVYRGNIPDQYSAERAFVDAVSNTITNFDEYSSCDVQAIIDQGYENFGSGKIYFEEVPIKKTKSL